MNIYIYTFGCKVNQVESENIVNNAEKHGFTPVTNIDEAELVVLNSCAVTENAEKKFRNLIKKLKKDNPSVVIAATGCAAEKDKEKLKDIGADIVVTNSGKMDILRYISENSDFLRSISEPHEFVLAENPKMITRTRAFVKIQDGCDSFCAYCIIPSLRGKPSSRGMDSVVNEVRHLVESGHKEIVPVGIHVGKYGLDLEEGVNLGSLIKRLLNEMDGFRIRLTSIELNELTDGMVSLLAENQDRICRHYHIPLQSGSTDVLKKMRRHYTAHEYIEKVRMLKKLVPDCTIGADIIVGFPSETDENFRETVNTVRMAGIDHIHVFSYSDRSGTEASLMEGKLDAKTKSARAKELRDIAKEMKRASAERMVGKRLKVLTQNDNTGLTDNFFTVIFPNGVEQNQLLDVLITGVGNDNTLKAEIIGYEH
ncbi:tRNA (N(6)-L-threonylcarbamoyladenosine(37)-C(2))-methylthiotransferase MtaB [Seleniivibrio woodruffii]|uniref:tRNA (N(6)-L-threonylcarbamoyladenosine(37)-C(2))- methylthiotransferase MtaB n=1 Tax=Seleniivibrio woodruffii TaxID=1078050 RepID=UPI0026F274F1|nr:tRNA (N(6)-L-threonylcarbamoyladenosine(37)-C(2))-methylthiotransferase MtaB [Seleniivibrio woodruffii]